MNRLIVFEGIDGGGKTTQIATLEKEFAAKRKPLRLRETGGTRIREISKSGRRRADPTSPGRGPPVILPR